MSECAQSMPAYFEVGANNGAWMSQTMLRHARERKSATSPLPRSFVVEPNPRHAAELEVLVQRYGTHYERAAAWSSDGQMTFHFRGNDETSTLFSRMSLRDNRLKHLNCSDPRHSPDSFARLATPWTTNAQLKPPEKWERRPKFKSRFICDRARSEEVATIDLARFLRHWMRPCERTHVKMDIEGAEYEVLTDLVRKGVVCSFATFHVEFHLPNLQLRQAMLDRGLWNRTELIQRMQQSCPSTRLAFGSVSFSHG
jgi:FkbM family methyltransferase